MIWWILAFLAAQIPLGMALGRFIRAGGGR